MFIRRDVGRFIKDPQQTYAALCSGLDCKQLSIEALTALTSEEEVLQDRQLLRKDCKGCKGDPKTFLTPWELSNKTQYEKTLDEKYPVASHADQAFVVGQSAHNSFAKFTHQGVLPLFTKTDRITWLRQRNRHLTTGEKFLGHGWPMNEQLASLLKIPATFLHYFCTSQQDLSESQGNLSFPTPSLFAAI